MKTKIEATIPTTQYGNLRPTFDDVEDINEAMESIERLWRTYGDTPLNKKEGVFVEVSTFTGETIFYDVENHIYKDAAGNQMVNATTYKKRFEKPFGLDFIANKVALKYGVDISLIKDMWSNNSLISVTFGNAVHYAMKQYWKHRNNGCDDKEYHLPKHPILRSCVESFPEDGDIIAEEFVSSVAEGMVGQIDAIKVLDKEKKVCELWDYKTDAKIEKAKLKLHYIQLSFYAHILRQFGWTVQNIIVWNYTGDGWVEYKEEPKELKELEASLKK